jgi:SlyX protein
MSLKAMHERKIEELEAKVAFIEAANNDLSAVVYRQQQEIDQLRMRVEALMRQLNDWRDTQNAWTSEDEKPPHY